MQVVADSWLETQIDIVYWGAIFHESLLNKYAADAPHYYHKETEVSVLGIDKQSVSHKLDHLETLSNLTIHFVTNLTWRTSSVSIW